MTYKSAVKILVMAAALLAWLTGAARADTLADIKTKGVLTVGVKADYPPYGYRDTSGEIVGMEVDLAKDIARRLGVKLQLEPVVASNRMQFLKQRKAELIIATMTVNDDRKKSVGVLEPYYYASGVAVLSAKSAGIKSAADLHGKTVCAIRGSAYNNDIHKLTARDLTIAETEAETYRALAGGLCAAFAYDDVLLKYKKHAEADKWRDFDVVPLDLPVWPWAVAVNSDDKEAPWGQFIAEVLTDWHKSGLLTELEAKWLGQNTSWLLDQRKSTN